MKKTTWLVVTILLIIGVLAGTVGCASSTPTATGSQTTVTKTVTATPGTSGTQVIKWTIAAANADSAPFGYWNSPDASYNSMLHALMDRGFAKWVQKVSNGRLVLTVVEPNSIFPTAESVQNIGAGSIECAFFAQNWVTGTIPEANVAGSLPYSIPDAEHGMDLYYNYGFKKIMDQVYAEKNCIFVPVPLAEVAGLITAFPAPTLDSAILFHHGTSSKYGLLTAFGLSATVQ